MIQTSPIRTWLVLPWLFSLLACRGALSQGIGKLIVSVQNDEGRVVGDATVIADRDRAIGITDSVGVVRAVLTIGTHTLEVKRLGYRPESVSVAIVRDSATVTVRLHSMVQVARPSCRRRIGRAGFSSRVRSTPDQCRSRDFSYWSAVGQPEESVARRSVDVASVGRKTRQRFGRHR